MGKIGATSLVALDSGSSNIHVAILSERRRGCQYLMKNFGTTNRISVNFTHQHVDFIANNKNHRGVYGHFLYFYNLFLDFFTIFSVEACEDGINGSLAEDDPTQLPCLPVQGILRKPYNVVNNEANASG